MAKTEQALVLEPSTELTFKGPFTDIVTAYLKLQNPTDKKICFKVKTTAPKRYCVRPNGGILDPGSSVSVAVMLQPFEYDPSEKSKHKFMVQSLFAPDKLENQDQLWKDTPPEALMDTKLKCVFEMPEAQQNAVQDLIQEEKAKPVKNEPASTPPFKMSAAGSIDEKKLIEEARRLQSEVNLLTNENRKLKDEGARLRKVAMADTLASTPAPSSYQSTAMVEKKAGIIPTVIFIIIAVLLGLIIGKFIL